jgi:hypothetical protein
VFSLDGNVKLESRISGAGLQPYGNQDAAERIRQPLSLP